MNLPKLFLTFVSFFALFFIFSNPAFAADFDAAYDVLYDVGNEGQTRVTQDVTFTNKTTNRFATRYTISIGSTRITNIAARDNLGAIKPEVSVKDDYTQINLTFNEKVVGKDKKLHFVVSYDNPEVAVKNGTLWEITIPKLSPEEDVTNYSLKLRTPKSFGDVHYITPQPSSTNENDKKEFSFAQEDLFKYGVSAAFGNGQTFALTLKYHLYNPNLFGDVTEIALPPDTSYQQVDYESIEPRPESVYADSDGNYMARYSLDAGERLDVIAKLKIKTLNNDRKFYSHSWSKQELDAYLGPNRYWETQHPLISSKAKELKTPEAIFSFVSTTLKYGYSRLNSDHIDRLGAVGALNNPDLAICMEYTDLMIALLRAAGVPARELNGYAYTQNERLRPVSIGGEESSDILHSWVEYYDFDRGYWVQVDPTWTSTTGGVDYFNKLDNNHLVFVIKGHSSESPYPAGSYKYTDKQEKDIDVVFAESEISTNVDIQLSLADTRIVAGFPNNSSVDITNNSGRGASDLAVNIKTNDLQLVSQNNQKIAFLPPFGKVKLDLKLRESELFVNREEELTLVMSALSGLDKLEREIKESIKIQPFYIYARLPLLLISIPLILLTVILVVIRTQLSRLKIPKQVPPAPH